MESYKSSPQRWENDREKSRNDSQKGHKNRKFRFIPGNFSRLRTKICQIKLITCLKILKWYPWTELRAHYSI